MVYRRTHQVVKRLAARRSAILAAARDAAADGGMAAVQIAPVAIRANVAAGTVYRYFSSKADLISELIAEVSRDELAAIRRAAEAAPGPSSALAAAVTTVAVHVLSQRKLAWGILAEPVDVEVTASRLASRREISAEMASRIDAAVRAGHLPAQDTALAATALLGALHEALVGPLAPDNLEDPGKMRDAVQTVTLLALRAVGVMDARARRLVVQQPLVARIFRHHAMQAPDDREAASGGDVRRDRHDRRLRPLACDPRRGRARAGPADQSGQVERLGDLPRGVRDGIAGGGFRRGALCH